MGLLVGERVREYARGMTWLTWLLLAVVVAAVAAVTGIKPKGTRHVAGTRLMGVGRIVLVIIAYAAYRARSGA